MLGSREYFLLESSHGGIYALVIWTYLALFQHALVACSFLMWGCCPLAPNQLCVTPGLLW